MHIKNLYWSKQIRNLNKLHRVQNTLARAVLYRVGHWL